LGVREGVCHNIVTGGLERGNEEGIEPGSRPALHIHRDVGIAIKGHADIRVSEPLIGDLPSKKGGCPSPTPLSAC